MAYKWFLVVCQLCYSGVSKIKQSWPGIILVTALPQYSESNGGVERRNRNVDGKFQIGFMKTIFHNGQCFFHSPGGKITPITFRDQCTSTCNEVSENRLCKNQQGGVTEIYVLGNLFIDE